MALQGFPLPPEEPRLGGPPPLLRTCMCQAGCSASLAGWAWKVITPCSGLSPQLETLDNRAVALEAAATLCCGLADGGGGSEGGDVEPVLRDE